MGNVSQKQAASDQRRLSNWRATGIVALRDGKVKSLPSVIFDLGQTIRTLDATNNKITEIPTGVHVLSRLQRLTLDSNCVQYISPMIGALVSLRHLSLRNNQLTSLPPQISGLTNLEVLILSGNSLQKLPDSLGKLTKLIVLHIQGNVLQCFPDSVGSCVALQEIRADGNALARLPPTICQLSQLKVLTLDNNQMGELPSQLLTGCDVLQTLSIHGNSISAADLQAMDGYQEFEKRRKHKIEKKISGNVLLELDDLDDGVTRTQQ